MAKLSPEEIRKLKETKQRAEWWAMIKGIVRMAFFHAVFGRDRRK
jgi:hypothetical protein